ncbi:hypothetical protein BDN72DRAFT_957431 [Pluteus cervinus]|uniref:Uncharacterized protein n=1 Tax=Pluteus cervinus TaxID=181527 RepID=A0ACD3B2K4_9AGAR|nr:hypothetical protein BDN72DRAFT_957431 [Pluteus cervinus]
MNSQQNIECILSLVEQFPIASSAPKPVDSVDWEKHRIDTAITKLENVLSILKRKSNTLSFINRLSSDILLYIFTYVQTSRDPGEEIYDPTYIFNDVPVALTKPIIWIRSITHVCSQWRDIALSYPVLWTTIQSCSGAWKQEVLTRSRSAPLSIVCQAWIDSTGLRKVGNTSPSHAQGLKQILEHHIHRAKTLELYLPRTWCGRFVSAHLPKVTDTLETCIIWVGKAPGSDGIDTIALPFQFLQNCAASLRHLELRDCIFDSSESLHETIHLPRLSTLAIHGQDSERVVEVFRAISIPDTCAIVLDCWVRQDDAFALGPVIRQIWEAKSKAGNPLLRMDVANWDNIDTIMVKSKGDNHDGELTLTLRCWMMDLSPGFLGQLWASFPLATVSSLGFVLDANPDWPSLAQQCPNLRVLVVHNGGIDELFQTLDNAHTDASGLTPEDAAGKPPFVKLERIVFRGTMFSKERGQRFVDCLQRRSDLGLPIRDVSFYSHCTHHWLLDKIKVEGELRYDGCESDPEDWEGQEEDEAEEEYVH